MGPFVLLLLLFHFKCLQYSIALRASLLVFLCLALKPFFSTMFMEIMSADRDPVNFDTFLKSVHANDTVRSIKLVETLSEIKNL